MYPYLPMPDRLILPAMLPLIHTFYTSSLAAE